MKNISKYALIALMTSALSTPAFATSGGSASASGSTGASASGTVSAGSNTGTGSSATTRAQIGAPSTNAGNNTGTGSSGVSRGGALSGTLGAGVNTATTTLRGQVNGRNIDTDTSANTSVIGSGVAGSNVVGNVKTGSRAALNATTTGVTGVVGGVTGTAADSMTQYSNEDFTLNDADRSNTLSFNEYLGYSGTTGGQAEAQARFAQFDTNNDSFLSQDELRASGSAAVTTTP